MNDPVLYDVSSRVCDTSRLLEYLGADYMIFGHVEKNPSDILKSDFENDRL